MVVWLCNSNPDVSTSCPYEYNIMAGAYAAHNLATLPTLPDHISGAGAYFTARKTARRVLRSIQVRITRLMMFSVKFRSGNGGFVHAAQCKRLQRGAVLEQICTELATCS